jgi:hypothetical protein
MYSSTTLLLLLSLLLFVGISLQSCPVVRCKELNVLETEQEEDSLELEILSHQINTIDCNDKLVCKLDCRTILNVMNKKKVNCQQTNDEIFLDLTEVAQKENGKKVYDMVCVSKAGNSRWGKERENSGFSTASETLHELVESITGVSTTLYVQQNFREISKKIPGVFLSQKFSDIRSKIRSKKTADEIFSLYKNFNKNYVIFATEKDKDMGTKALLPLADYADSLRGIIKLCYEKIENSDKKELLTKIKQTVEEYYENWLKESQKKQKFEFSFYQNLKSNGRQQFKKFASTFNELFTKKLVDIIESHKKIERTFCYCSSFSKFIDSQQNVSKNSVIHQTYVELKKKLKVLQHFQETMEELCLEHYCNL